MLNNQIIATVKGAFVKNCIVLIGRAYDNLRVSCVVNHDMDENTVSENLRILMSKDLFSTTKGIMVAREQPIDNGSLLTSSQSADTMPRIDFKFQTSWCQMQHTFVFYMEAKNLYANNFIKTGNSNETSAKYYHKRYVETGINHLLKGYYPPDTCLLGYILEGTVSDTVDGVNIQVSSILSQRDVLTQVQSLYPSLSTYISYHSPNREITHLMLKF